MTPVSHSGGANRPGITYRRARGTVVSPATPRTRSRSTTSSVSSQAATRHSERRRSRLERRRRQAESARDPSRDFEPIDQSRDVAHSFNDRDRCCRDSGCNRCGVSGGEHGVQLAVENAGGVAQLGARPSSASRVETPPPGAEQWLQVEAPPVCRRVRSPLLPTACFFLGGLAHSPYEPGHPVGQLDVKRVRKKSSPMPASGSRLMAAMNVNDRTRSGCCVAICDMTRPAMEMPTM